MLRSSLGIGWKRVVEGVAIDKFEASISAPIMSVILLFRTRSVKF